VRKPASKKWRAVLRNGREINPKSDKPQGPKKKALESEGCLKGDHGPVACTQIARSPYRGAMGWIVDRQKKNRSKEKGKQSRYWQKKSVAVTKEESQGGQSQTEWKDEAEKEKNCKGRPTRLQLRWGFLMTVADST